MRQVADNTFSLGTGAHNFYILGDGDQATVIDAGCSGEWSKLTGALSSLGIALANVVGVLVTHAHADHFGLAKRAVEQGLEVSVHEEEETRAKGTYQGRFAVTPAELPIFKVHTLRNFLPMVFVGVTRLEHVDDVTTFRHGDQLDLPGRPIAIHTPGHTEGHTMFHLPDRGLLFTGDGLITMDLLGPRRGPQMIEDRFNLDTEMARQSLDRIVELEADLLLPGHGEPWAGSPAKAAEMARS